jgi:hypothetical protein
VVQEKEEVCGGKGEVEIGGYGFCCQRGDVFIKGFVLWLSSCPKVVAAENTVERDKEERELSAKRKKTGGRLVFCQLFTRFSSHSGHGIHPYL